MSIDKKRMKNLAPRKRAMMEWRRGLHVFIATPENRSFDGDDPEEKQILFLQFSDQLERLAKMLKCCHYLNFMDKHKGVTTDAFNGFSGWVYLKESDKATTSELYRNPDEEKLRDRETAKNFFANHKNKTNEGENDGNKV